MPFHTTLARQSDAFRGIPERTWRLYPFYLLAVVLIGFGVMALLPGARERFTGGWTWIFDGPGQRVYGCIAIVLGAAHCVSVFMAWRLRYATMVLLCPTFFAIAGKILQTGGTFGPGVLMYLLVAIFALWPVRWRQRIE